MRILYMTCCVVFAFSAIVAIKEGNYSMACTNILCCCGWGVGGTLLSKSI